MLEQMTQATLSANITRAEALYLATLGGAKVLGLAGRIGSLDVGKDADFVVVDKDSIHRVYLRGKLVYF